jgi:hypothetical protein
MVDLEDYDMYLDTSYHCKIYTKLSKKDSIESKVEVKPSFAMLLIRPCMA